LQDDFRILNNSIINIHTGSEFLFYGLWRHIDEVKSLEGIDICWIEEAHNLTQEQWEILNPTIRKEGSEFWIIFNPRLITDFVYKRFVTNTPDDTIKHKINYIDNPFLSQTMLKVIEGAKAEDEDDYTHIYLGEPKMDDEESVIQRSHVMAAIDAHIKLNINIRGRKTIGFDVADAGEDFNASISSQGSLAYHLDCWKGKEDELLKSCARVWARAREDGSMIKYDAIGVGATAGAKFNELNTQNKTRVTHQKFFAGGTPNKPDFFYKLSNIKNRDFFSNIKAQAWWELADRFRNTYNAIKNGQKFRDDEMIFIDSNLDKLDQLIDELCTPKRDFDLAGRVKVESKKDLAKRDIASPNLADAFVMSFVDTSSGGLF
jgi:phage terminase large subunit